MTANKTTAIMAMMAVRVFVKYASEAADAQDDAEPVNSAETANDLFILSCIIKDVVCPSKRWFRL